MFPSLTHCPSAGTGWGGLGQSPSGGESSWLESLAGAGWEAKTTRKGPKTPCGPESHPCPAARRQGSGACNRQGRSCAHREGPVLQPRTCPTGQAVAPPVGASNRGLSRADSACASPLYFLIFIVVQGPALGSDRLTLHGMSHSRGGQAPPVPEPTPSPNTLAGQTPNSGPCGCTWRKYGSWERPQAPWEAPARPPVGRFLRASRSPPNPHPPCLLSPSRPAGKLHTQHRRFASRRTFHHCQPGIARKWANPIPGPKVLEQRLLGGKAEGICRLLTSGTRASGPPSPGGPGILAGTCGPRISPGEAGVLVRTWPVLGALDRAPWAPPLDKHGRLMPRGQQEGCWPRPSPVTSVTCLLGPMTGCLEKGICKRQHLSEKTQTHRHTRANTSASVLP